MGEHDSQLRRVDRMISKLMELRARVSADRDSVLGMSNEQSKKQPSIGRIVHFNHSDGGKRAAIITAVFNEECVNLAVYPPSGPAYSETSVVQGGDPGRWQWPEKV